MDIRSRFLLAGVVTIMAVGAAEARGPLLQPWLIYPSRVMDQCRKGTAPQSYAARCADLLGAYGRALEVCMPQPAAGPVIGAEQVAIQQASPDCAASAARTAAAAVK